MRMHIPKAVHVVVSLLVVVLTFGCSGGGGGSGGDGQNNPPPAANTQFNGTFTGQLSMTQQGQTATETWTMSLSVNSPLRGSFQTTDGIVGSIEGEASGNTATFTATEEATVCPATFTGTMQLTDANTLSVQATGSDCTGALLASGSMSRDTGDNGGPTNTPPVADAGDDQDAFIGETVSLDGSRSVDVDGDVLGFQWFFEAIPAGSTATLSDPTAVAPSFTPDLPGAYVVRLIVDDGQAESVPDQATITVVVGELNVVGSWRGTTSQGRELAFEVGPDGVVSLSIDVSFHPGGCLVTSDSTTTFGSPLAITDNTFVARVTGVGTSALSYTLTGTFTSDTQASGSADLTFRQTFPLPSCTATVRVTWTATKE